MARGKLRIYLGAAPGVGKTYAMLNEGWRANARGKDVVIGYVETYDRPNTRAQIRDLEVLPRARIDYRGQVFEEMDLDRLLERHPEVALVDELAHTNVPGSRHKKRWEDVEELLEAGINVISTLNIQHVESLNDVVERITGVAQRETIPDAVVRAADQIELVDMSAEALRRRMAHGNVYPPEKVNAALSNYFREGNLAALRELALMWVADRVDEALHDYRQRHGIAMPWETRERVIVAIDGTPEGEHLIRRGARMAARTKGELLAVHVRSADGLTRPSPNLLEHQRALVAELGGRYLEITGGDVAETLTKFARAENATQLILGAPQKSRWEELIHGSIINRVVRLAGPIDVHVISSNDDAHEILPRPIRRRHLAPLPHRRRQMALLLGLLGVPLLGFLLAPFRASLGTPGALLLFLLFVVGIAIMGGAVPALVVAVLAFGVADWFFIPPLHNLTIGHPVDAIALGVFLTVAVAVSAVGERAARRTVLAARSQAEAEALARLAASSVLSAGEEALPNLLSQLRETFGLTAVAVLSPVPADGQVEGQVGVPAGSPNGLPAGNPNGLASQGPAPIPAAIPAGRAGWRVEASAGAPVPTRPEEASFSAALDEGSVLALAGGELVGEDTRLLNSFVAQLRVAQAGRRLLAEAAWAGELAESNRLRTALLAAVSHDLRTPLASIKASASSLLSDEVDWSPDAIHGFARTIEGEADRLNAVVSNLLDMSRLQTGALHLKLRAVGLEEVVSAALGSLSGDMTTLTVDVPDSLPAVEADPALLERAVANVVDNALSWSPSGRQVRVEAGEIGDRVDLRVIDQGPGIPMSERDRVFQPFQRLGDRGRVTPNGVGLGLAVARGFVEAMGGEILVEDTPGGGTTMVLSLRRSE
ncbi:MAG: sensor histidine kinase KdpD [Actinobacteria bacterium]|nr:MAG: sensor histidine kinase KdpD [Actinomycetota bacterium]